MVSIAKTLTQVVQGQPYKYVCAVDGSKTSFHAVKVAIAMMKSEDTLTVVHNFSAREVDANFMARVDKMKDKSMELIEDAKVC